MQWLFHLVVNVNNHYDWFLWGKWKFDLTVIDQLSIMREGIMATDAVIVNITPSLGSMNVHVCRCLLDVDIFHFINDTFDDGARNFQPTTVFRI